MAIVSSAIAGTTAINKLSGGKLFSGIGGKIGSIFSGTDFAQQDRNRKRGELEKVGFNWRRTSGVPSGEEWNIDNYSSQALDNVARLYDNFGDIAVDLHNNKKISNSRIAENYDTIQQLALAKEEEQRGVLNQITGATGERKLVNAGAGVLGAIAIAGGLFYVINKG